MKQGEIPFPLTTCKPYSHWDQDFKKESRYLELIFFTCEEINACILIKKRIDLSKNKCYVSFSLFNLGVFYMKNIKLILSMMMASAVFIEPLFAADEVLDGGVSRVSPSATFREEALSIESTVSTGLSQEHRVLLKDSRVTPYSAAEDVHSAVAGFRPLVEAVPNLHQALVSLKAEFKQRESEKLPRQSYAVLDKERLATFNGEFGQVESFLNLAGRAARFTPSIGQIPEQADTEQRLFEQAVRTLHSLIVYAGDLIDLSLNLSDVVNTAQQDSNDKPYKSRLVKQMQVVSPYFGKVLEEFFDRCAYFNGVISSLDERLRQRPREDAEARQARVAQINAANREYALLMSTQEARTQRQEENFQILLNGLKNDWLRRHPDAVQ